MLRFSWTHLRSKRITMKKCIKQEHNIVIEKLFLQKGKYEFNILIDWFWNADSMSPISLLINQLCFEIKKMWRLTLWLRSYVTWVWLSCHKLWYVGLIRARLFASWQAYLSRTIFTRGLSPPTPTSTKSWRKLKVLLTFWIRSLWWLMMVIQQLIPLDKALPVVFFLLRTLLVGRCFFDPVGIYAWHLQWNSLQCARRAQLKILVSSGFVCSDVCPR